MRNYTDHSGKKFGRLTAVSYIADYKGRSAWACICDCGAFVATRASNLTSGRTKSCGCYQKDKASERMKVHGYEYGSVEYREHQNNLRLIRKYGITTEQRDEMIQAQDNKCLICESDFDELDHTPHVDHCHKSGDVRGVLCKLCNTGLGQFKDNVALLKSAIQYLEKQ